MQKTPGPGVQFHEMFRSAVARAKLTRLATSWPVLLCLVSAILIWRCNDVLVAPELRAEDGSKVFAYFYEHREFSALFRIKAGYTPFLPNVFGYLAVRAPAKAMPYVLTIAPALLTLVTFTVLRAEAYRRYLSSDGARFALCLALAIAPIGTHFTVCHTDYSIWNALLLLLLVAILPMPRAAITAILFSLASAALIWTHPLSILALPATLLWLWRDQGLFQRALHGLLAVCQVAHVWLGTRPENAVISKGSQSIGSRLVELSTVAWNHLCHAVIRPTVFPWGPATIEFDYAISGLFALALLACAFVPKERFASRVFYAWVGYGLTASMLLIALARAERGLQSTRYYYVPKAFATIALCLLLSQILLSAVRRLAPRFGLSHAAPALAALLLFAALNHHLGRIGNYRISDPENAASVARFFSDLAEAEREHGGHCNIRLRCRKKHGDWSFAIDTRRNCE